MDVLVALQIIQTYDLPVLISILSSITFFWAFMGTDKFLSNLKNMLIIAFLLQ